MMTRGTWTCPFGLELCPCSRLLALLRRLQISETAFPCPTTLHIISGLLLGSSRSTAGYHPLALHQRTVSGPDPQRNSGPDGWLYSCQNGGTLQAHALVCCSSFSSAQARLPQSPGCLSFHRQQASSVLHGKECILHPAKALLQGDVCCDFRLTIPLSLAKSW